MNRPSHPLPSNRVASHLPLELIPVPVKKRRFGQSRWTKVAAVLLVVGIGAGVWAWTHRSDPQLAELTDLRKKMIDPSLSKEDRQELGREMRTKFEALSPEQRDADHHRAHPEFEKMMAKKVSDFFSLPPDKRNAALDQEIDRMEEIRKRVKEMSKGGAPPAGATAMHSAPADARNQVLSSISADLRAEMTTYSELLRARASQRGIAMPPGGPIIGIGTPGGPAIFISPPQ
jgi:hypothetical protein